MRNTMGNTSKRSARVMGLILVLGMPLALMAPIDSTIDRRGATSEVASSASAFDVDGSTDQTLEGHEPAAPATPLPDFDSIEIQENAPSAGATPVTTIVNDPRCGAGFTSSAITGRDAFTCFHSALDPLPSTQVNAAQAASTAPVCKGNGVNGPRIQLIYMYVEGQPNRTAHVVPRIVNEFVPRMEAVFRQTSKLQGREIGMRLHMPGCKLKVDTVMIDSDNGQPDDPNRLATRITDHLVAAGYDSTDRKYVLWFDGGNKGACGIAPALTPLLERGYNPTPATSSNVGWQALIPETAIIFRYGFPLLGDAPAQFPGATAPPECWGRGGTGARTEIHELIHLLGAVNLSAPNSNGFGHCTDDHDIMCYGERGVSTVPRCATPVEQLDCGADDYFNARPPVGSYLSRAWNTANSRFLGDAIVHDAVPIEIPRP